MHMAGSDFGAASISNITTSPAGAASAGTCPPGLVRANATSVMAAALRVFSGLLMVHSSLPAGNKPGRPRQRGRPGGKVILPDQPFMCADQRFGLSVRSLHYRPF